MTAAEIRAFRARDWQMLERSKSDYWAQRKEVMTPSALIAIASELLLYTRRLKPDWPNAAEREADLEAHRRLSGILSAASLRAR